MTYSEDKNNYIVTIHNQSKGNRKKAKDLFEAKYGFKPSNIKLNSEWGKVGLEHVNPPQGGHRHGLTEEMFRELYNNCNGDVQKMADKSGYKESGLIGRCSNLELPIFNKTESLKKENRDFLLEPRDMPQKY